MTARSLPITPPPSLEDILSAGDTGRVGSVDFSHLAAAAPEPEPEPEPQPEPPLAALPEHGTTPTVEEVAESVIAHMRATQAATLRHLEAIEAEAARRCELLTAQAELDAELIRLHARREAHAIITAARMRAGEGTDAIQDSERLHEIGETFSRFAETLETTVAPATRSHDHPLGP